MRVDVRWGGKEQLVIKVKHEIQVDVYVLVNDVRNIYLLIWIDSWGDRRNEVIHKTGLLTNFVTV